MFAIVRPAFLALLAVLAVAGLALRVPDAVADASAPARVVIDQRTGAVVIGGNVRVARVAVTTGGLTVRTGEAPTVSHPGPFGRSGDTVVVPRTRVRVDEGRGTGAAERMLVIEENATLGELVARLNGLGLKPGDVIGVLQAIKRAGALQAEIVAR